MRNLSKLLQAAVLVMFSFTAYAAAVPTADAWKWVSKTNDFSTDTGFISQAWLVSGNISGSDVASITAALLSEGVDLTIDAVDKVESDSPGTGELESTEFQAAGLGIEGVILKTGGKVQTLVAIFSESVDSFYYNTGFSPSKKNYKDLSHKIFIGGDWVTEITTPVPTPAAAFLLAPALVGLMGFRRKLR